MLNENWHQQVIHFWFEELTPKDWYQSTPELDESIKVQFEPLIEQLAQIEPADMAQAPKTVLAAIIALDQFPRNSYRGTAKAFAYDPLAQAISEHAITHRLDQSMTEQQKHFCYMPFMHAENIAMQDQCVALFTRLDNENGLKHAIQHRDIIEQFGRFPHRNAVLLRESTADELQYLESASRFGQ